MKYFVTADVHSYYTLLKQALDKAGFDINNPEHIFVHCGDLLDRGDESLDVLKFVNGIPDNRKILIRGNHEDLLGDCISRREFYQHDLHNGTVKTIMQLCGRDPSDIFITEYHDCFDIIKENKELIRYIACLKDYAEVGDYIFVHGWIPCKRDDANIYHTRGVHYVFDAEWRTKDRTYWHSARWINGMDAWNQGVKIDGKTIVCGHFHTSWGHCNLHHDGSEFDDDAKFDPFVDNGICAIDGCTAHSHKVNCVVFDI